MTLDLAILATFGAVLTLAHVLENLLTARCIAPDCPRCAAANRKAHQ